MTTENEIDNEGKLVNPMDMVTPEQATAGFIQSLEMMMQVAPMLGVSKDDVVGALAVHLFDVLTENFDDYHGMVVELRRNGDKLDIKVVSEGEAA